ncbi:MAG TPA: proton-conducting transporter membrane subunit, partial [Caldimonas sp.]|nr:proton-conducting transporter membrane subunit [Caldimonas sp.]
MNLTSWLKAYPDAAAVAPLALLLTLACAVALVDLFVRDPQRRVSYRLAQLSLLAVLGLSLAYFDKGFTIYAMQRMIVADPMGHLLGVFATLAAMVSLAYARPYAADRDMLKGELFSLSMFSLLGILVMLEANNFLIVYLGVELMSLSLYALVAMRRDDIGATEAAMKYFVLGALSSGFLLYGLSMMYGATG